MIKKPQLFNLLKPVNDEFEEISSKLQKPYIENQFDISQKLLYAIEKPTINTKNTNSCRNSTGRLSAFDFLNQSTTNVNEKKTFLIVLKYFQNENKNVVMARKSTNLYGFSKASSKLR
ncbi:unnamed protein product [Paramecium sonneborni]|uniref:Uncharacterized protein n=1 Tax=Paramecium sonneborni TaxID=65129 RepID=A0A8S1L6V8_9CILI|nr:unnamed protein product [Paramecium sonneborni]